MIPAKTISMGNSTPLPKGVIQHTSYTLTDIVETVFWLWPAKQNEAKPPVAAPEKKRYRGCKNNCTDVNQHKLLLPDNVFRNRTCLASTQFFDVIDNGWNYLEHITYDPICGDLKNRCIFILVDSDYDI